MNDRVIPEKTVEVHHCFSQPYETLPGRRCSNRGVCKWGSCTCKKCKCRKLVTYEEAKSMVDLGEAEYIIVEFREYVYPEICGMCKSDEKLKLSCDLCRKTGLVNVTKVHAIPGPNIVETRAPKTPRAATIEKAHIERANQADVDFRDGYTTEEISRIELYHVLDLESLNSLIVPWREDLIEGEVLFPFGADQRSESSTWHIQKADVDDYYRELNND